MGKLIRALTSDGAFRAFFIEAKDMIQTAADIHQLNALCTAVLGRSLMATSILGSMLKDNSSVTLQIKGDGPCQMITCISQSNGNVRGYIQNPQVDLPQREDGKLDVKGAVGNGILTVIKDMGLKEPFVGKIELVSGEIAEDMTAYFAISEQTPSACALGVLVDRDLSVKQAGGFVVQAMPFAQNETIEKLENNIYNLKSITTLLEEMSINDIIYKILDGFEVEIFDEKEVAYECTCSYERTLKAMCALPKADIKEMIEDNKPVETECRFCNKKYSFSVEELKNILNAQ